MRYLFHISYVGTNFYGWQRQPRHLSVQEKIEDTLSSFTRKKTIILGCGRTDSGVHAAQYFFHIDTDYSLTQDSNDILNKILQPDISINQIIAVSNKLHAQHSVVSREYRYFAHFYPNPFISGQSSFYPFKILFPEEAQKAAALLIGEHDFVQLCLTPTKHETTLCRIIKSEIEFSSDQKLLRFIIEGDHFLKSMVRIITGQLLRVAIGEISAQEFEKYIHTQLKPQYNARAYPQGLYLYKVCYPEIEVDTVIPPVELFFNRI